MKMNMVGQKGNMIIFGGFIFLAVFIYLARFKQLFTEGIALTGYLVGCAILIIGIVMNKRGQ